MSHTDAPKKLSLYPIDLQIKSIRCLGQVQLQKPSKQYQKDIGQLEFGGWNRKTEWTSEALFKHLSFDIFDQ